MGEIVGRFDLGFEEVLLHGRLLVEDLLEVVELELLLEARATSAASQAGTDRPDERSGESRASLLLREGLVEGLLEDLDNDRPEAVFFEAHPVLAGDVEELIPRA